QLAWLAEHGAELYLPADAHLFVEGAPADQFYVLLDGNVRITKRIGDADTVITIHEPGHFTGELSLLTEGATNIATATAITPVRLRQIPVDALRQIVAECSELGETIITALASRAQDANELIRQREKLAALGKLSAGLAHELNNPASAVLRSVQQLQSNL